MRSIGSVATLTGLSPETLRIWERRYAVVSPERDELGHRRYSAEDVTRLKCLAALVRRGYAVRNLARLSVERLSALLAEGEPHGPLRRAAELKNFLLAAIEGQRHSEVERHLYMSALCLDPVFLLERIVSPIMSQARCASESRQMRVREERKLTGAFSRALNQLCEEIVVPARAPTVMMTTLAGEQHEMGALAATFFAVSRGIQSRFLGSDMSPDEIAGIARADGVAGVGVSVTCADGYDCVSQLTSLRSQLPGKTKLWVGGRCAASLKGQRHIAPWIVPSLRSFDRQLDQLLAQERSRD